MSHPKISDIIKQRPNFASEPVNGERILVPVRGRMAEFNTMLTLNPSASVLWEAINEQTTIESLVEALTNKYEVDRETARADVNEFIDELHTFMTSVPN
ncbi:Coenzyme PQQ synthesis protein D (PqqD) [Cyclonatronum proteinivorum]|uniref:Coenzyme PQQ synthesis protein D (PqqD) n=1 Tax=Cyclonatronum proteinivorum TaxID=1457365 RepID=A0A345UPS9_9BACT|nr:PqqD family protein [Cyclonatronum proteinivorum]AXJ02481.1 Coenzyme PQQ synthesis protein D (PqqD) [Cyclonatronum proteinivorum]